MVNKPKDPQPRLNREEWLEKAIEVLSREGSGKLRVQGLSEALGVSKGSFYWHFKDRAEFLRAIVEFWSERYTKKVITAAEASGAEGLECLRMVLGFKMEVFPHERIERIIGVKAGVFPCFARILEF